ncbi:iron complex transport system substrate-binding protein [Thiothrix eikelboomii]|uniref:Iron complex transport system substrate-binding protein n=1 Tax=Thiothrix eikelboomii TaxID=92487 RepID=A0A1T4WEI3_9GAMM|nr:iron complex transport system substrate-binding protein [Thiothrix eikelboomii]
MCYRLSLNRWCLSCFLLAVFSLATVAASSTPPQRIVSINLCADELLLLLADPQQISALTHLSQDKAASYLQTKALGYPTTQGLAEEVLPFKPDLVIAGEYGGLPTINLLKKLGIRVETLPLANNMQQVFSNIEWVASLTGHPERGAAIVKTMQARLAQLPVLEANAPLAAVYDPNGYTVGAASLRGQSIHLAGWRNAGELAGVADYGSLDLETMVSLQPDALIDSPYTLNTYSRAEALAKHPALRGLGLNPHIISIPSNQTICDGPWTLDTIETLVDERLTFLNRASESK